jgi:cytochrome c-type biogenesis protein CcmE
MKTGKILAIIATVIVVGGGLAYLLATSFGEAMVYFKTVDELLAERGRFDGQEVRVNGQLVEGSLLQKPGTDEFRFALIKNGQRIDVSYSGIIPDTMQPGREILVQGTLQPGSSSFHASEILTKCPSKYEDVARIKDESQDDR